MLLAGAHGYVPSLMVASNLPLPTLARSSAFQMPNSPTALDAGELEMS